MKSISSSADKTAPFLFQPGRGLLPPRLAGREAEQSVLRRFLSTLAANAAPPKDLILIGPRGNGKTALLRWFERQCTNRNAVDAVWLTPSDIPSLDALANRLAPKRLPLESFSVGLGALAGGGRLSRHPDALTKRLAARCKRCPLAVLLDEAHTLKVDIGTNLLNASQAVCGSGAPFLLALAGTPELEDRLNAMGASFWDRCETLPIGRLSAQASAEAIEVPLAAHGVTLAHDALRSVVAESQHYPYFLQLWGDAIWTKAKAAQANHITAAHIAVVKPSVDVKRDAYYRRRYNELKKANLHEVAAAVGTAFAGKSSISDAQMDDTLGAMPADAATQQQRRQTLQRLGYIWQADPGKTHWEPGIPSLMDYVRAERPAPTTGQSGDGALPAFSIGGPET